MTLIERGDDLLIFDALGQVAVIVLEPFAVHAETTFEQRVIWRCRAARC